MKRLERDALAADREAVKQLLDSLSPSDILGQMSFRSRLQEIDQRLEALSRETASDLIGSVALTFGGTPVHGSRSIDVEFATQITRAFQDLVSKRIATEEFGRLGSRGPLPLGVDSSLAISDVVRGSFGFVLEEASSNHELTDSVIKTAINDVTIVLSGAGSESLHEFERSIESLDPRLLVSLRTFFRTLDDSNATVRILEDKHDVTLDGPAVRRARQRVDMTEIDEQVRDDLVGVLIGLLPDSRRFEMELDGAVTIKGSVAGSYASAYLELLHGPEAPRLVGQRWRVKMKVREVRERNKPPRQVYTLMGLLEPVGRAG